MKRNKKNAKGEIITLLTSKVPLKDKEGNIIGVLGMYNDITEQKRLEHELNEKEHIIYQQSKMAAMGEMLENIAHQWRQPLSVISTSASGIKVEKEFGTLSDEFLIEAADIILRSTAHLSQTIDDFRDYFRQDKEKSNVLISSAFEKSLFFLSSKFKNRDIHVVQKIQEQTIFGLENELVQAIVNILNNANDALEKTQDQERLIFIDVNKVDCCINPDTSTMQKCDCMEIIIKDNAGGIDESILNRVFEPYFTTKHQSQGTGIGLYMTREIILKHLDGNITVSNIEYEYEGVKYKGAQFKIVLPTS